MSAVEHVVFFPAPDGTPAFRRLPSLDEVVNFVEHLRNERNVREVSVHTLTEVPLSFRTVYRVEVASDVPAQSAEARAAEPVAEVAEPVAEVAEVAEPVAEVAEPVAEVAEPVAEVAEVAEVADVVEPVATTVPPLPEVPVQEANEVPADGATDTVAAGDARTLGFFAS